MGITYLLIEENDTVVLIKKLNALLVAGWRPQGGISYNTNKHTYLQAVVMIES